ncbi:MAG TPA: hypothetical protein VK559_07175 [Ferruginibacter sp.]|nr:hypothetical protein [Ferruginibacter sp.]
MTTKQRVHALIDAGMVYIEANRHFTNGKIKIDHDVVVYGKDAEIEKLLLKLKK